MTRLGSSHAPDDASAAAGQLRVLLFSTLYPSRARPGHGLFVHTRLEHLLRSGQVDARVVAPVPWFPSSNPRFGNWSKLSATPRSETWKGVSVLHPRYLLPPKVGQTVAPLVLAAGALQTLRRLAREDFDFDVIDAHYFYPDGVAAALLGKALGKPVVITARGSDLNVLGRDAAARAMMRWAGRAAAACAGVCSALAEVLLEWGVPAQRVQVVRNGVDPARFHPVDRGDARSRLKLDGAPLLLSVGNLVPVKGHDLTIDAVAELAHRHPGVRLVIVGHGPQREALEALARLRQVHDRVHFAGVVPNEQLLDWYSAADMLVLASHSEGWANVLLESMACGTPVVASDVGGSAEVIGDSCAGVLMARRDAESLCNAVERLWRDPVDRNVVRRYAEQFTWDATTAAQLDIFRRVTGRPDVGQASPPAVGQH